MPRMADDPLLTAEQVSEMLGGIPLGTLKRWRADRRGPTPMRLGHHVRYRLSSVEQWLAEKDVEAARWMAS